MLHTHPEVTLSRCTFGHIHPAPVCLQLLIEWLLQGDAVNKVAAYIQAIGLTGHLHGYILPLGVSQAHILQEVGMLRAFHPVVEVQAVPWAIGHNLKLSLGSARAFQHQEGAPGISVLLQLGREEEALLSPRQLDNPAQVLCVHWGDVVKPNKTVSGHPRVRPSELLGANGLPVNVADAEKVKRCVFEVVTSCRRESQGHSYPQAEAEAFWDAGWRAASSQGLLSCVCHSPTLAEL